MHSNSGYKLKIILRMSHLTAVYCYARTDKDRSQYTRPFYALAGIPVQAEDSMKTTTLSVPLVKSSSLRKT